jgi:thiosulfate reductase cytochrome b subunit
VKLWILFLLLVELLGYRLCLLVSYLWKMRIIIGTSRRVRSVERTALRQLGYNFCMPNYRRSYNGSTYFFTVVTYHRQPISTAEAARNVFARRLG